MRRNSVPGPRVPAVRKALAAALAIGLVAAGAAWGGEFNPVRKAPPAAAAGAAGAARIIVKFRAAAAVAAASGSVSAKPAAAPAAALAARMQMKLRAVRRLAPNLQVLDLDAGTAGDGLDAELARLRADTAVEYAEPDMHRMALAVPDDPLYPGQWYLQSRTVAPSAIDAEAAWDTTAGSAGVVIADVDTGVLYDHPDLGRAQEGGRLLPGYDFVSDTSISNDGDGRDPDATDPGDWVTSTEASSLPFKDCTQSPSSWHGTRVAGILGARTNDGVGVAGTTWKAWILPVRALGKCGGYDSDILAAMRWAAGLHVDGVPDNPYPARIVNLSLGSQGACLPAYQDVVAELAAHGVLVVASAGNEGGPVDSPANCSGVVAVAGLRQVGTKVGFSSLGPEVTLGAPAGNCVNVGPGDPCLYSIDTTSDLGTRGAGTFSYTDQTAINVGTSFSAPIVSAIAALMLSVDGNLDAAELEARLQESAQPFPASSDPSVPVCHVPTGSNDLQVSECSCTTSTCGAGMADAPGAVLAALRPIAAVALPTRVSAGQQVLLSGAGSGAACGRSVATYAWAVVKGSEGLTSDNTAATSVAAPTSGAITLRLTVTDDAGAEDSADVVIGSNSATTSAPSAVPGDPCLAAFPAPDVAATLNPKAATVTVGTTRKFAAAVTGSLDTTVKWEVGSLAGGSSSVGTITSDGVYTAPADVPSPATVTVTAVPRADPSLAVSAEVTISTGQSSSNGASGGGGGGGGGSTGPLELVLGLAGWLLLRRERRGSSVSR